MSSCVAVDDWTTTLWGGEVGTRRGRSQRAELAPRLQRRQVVQQHSTAKHSTAWVHVPASPTNTSCGALLGPSPTAL